MKNWILELSFVKDFVANRQARSFMDGVNVEKANSQAHMTEAVEQSIAKLLGSFDMRNVITYDKKTGLIFVGGERIEEPTILSLQAEAKYFESSDLWKIMSNTLKEQAQRAIFENSKDFQDVLNGKMMLYNLSLQQKILDIFTSYKSKPKQ